jgi:predicted ATPase
VLPNDLTAATPDHPVRVGRYDVIGLIRGGGMGTVHDAIDRDHGARVALKTLSHVAPANLVRFKGEFRSVADLSHPNLVALYELACVDDLWFFTMERIDGGGLLARLRGEPGREGDVDVERTAPTVRIRDDAGHEIARPEPKPSPPRSFTAVRDAFAALARGLTALHAAGLSHLDVKPSNVLVDRAGRVVLVDFGLVRHVDASGAPHEGARAGSDPRSISGTPTWMAPEQYAGEGVGPASDAYALGLMLYAALTGVPAFAPASVPVMWLAKQTTQPTPPDALVREVPADLSKLALDLLRAEPGERPSDEEIVARLTGAAPPPHASVAPRTRVVGRAAELERLAAALDRARDGAAVVLVVGPSGVGKTTLLDALAEDADRRALVLRGRCYERESVPYKAFDALLDALAAHLAERDGGAPLAHLPAHLEELARVFPALATVPSIAARLPKDAPSSRLPVVELRRRATRALRELFAALAAERPLALLLDDLHWADADSASLLGTLLEAPAPRGLFVAATLRAVEAASNADVARWVAAARATRGEGAASFDEIELGPLSRDDAEQLAHATLARFGVSSAELPEAIAREAAGLPLFVEELARHAARHGGGADSATLEDVLLRRVEALSAAERALVEALAIANSPVPLGVAFEAAEITDAGVMRVLWSLGAGQFVRSTGPRAGDRVELHHDGVREAIVRALPRARVDDLHLALGRALAVRDAAAGVAGEACLFAAARHLSAVPHRLEGAERERASDLALAAARRARRSGSFALAFELFAAGARLLEAAAWTRRYDVALALHAGAAEAAYLSGAGEALAAHVGEVKARAATLDQLGAREAEIDACVAGRAYGAAVDRALEALALVGADIPANPTEAEALAELGRARAAVARVGPDGFARLPLATDPKVVAATRVLSRMASAAYFARPTLLPVLACRLVAMSVEHGLSSVTSYALAVYGIVLNGIGEIATAHTWGRVALDLVDRFEDKSLEARTRHVVHDLVCVWTVPLASTLRDLRAVVAIGKDTGDLEYAAYAAHAYVHNSLYASRDLGPLADEARAFGAFMRAAGQTNALHVHEPFERLLASLTGRAEDPARLDGGGFDEDAALEAARVAGSRSAQHILRLVMGIARHHFGAAAEASACLERARPFLDGVVSTWHTPMFHQYAALAIHALPETLRCALRAEAAASLAALKALAAAGAGNFLHRVHLVEAASLLADGDAARALASLEIALATADAGGWRADVGLAHELAARAHASVDDAAKARESLRAAARVYERWGAHAKAAAIEASIV